MIRVFESSEAVCVDTEEPADVERGVGDDRHGAVSTLRPLIRHRYPSDKQSCAHDFQFIHIRLDHIEVFESSDVGSVGTDFLTGASSPVCSST